MTDPADVSSVSGTRGIAMPSSSEVSVEARPTTALAVRHPCHHRWDLSRRTCVLCGACVYVEVVIS